MPGYDIVTSFFWLGKLLIAALATWRISASLYYAHGPFNIWHKMRRRVQIKASPSLLPVSESPLPARWYWTELHSQLSCFWCVTSWVSIVTLVVMLVFWWALVPFALSGAAILLTGGGRTIWRAGNDQ